MILERIDGIEIEEKRETTEADLLEFGCDAIEIVDYIKKTREAEGLALGVIRMKICEVGLDLRLHTATKQP